MDWGTFCKRKSSQQTAAQYHSGKPSGGRFSGNRNNRFYSAKKGQPYRWMLWCGCSFLLFRKYKEKSGKGAGTTLRTGKGASFPRWAGRFTAEKPPTGRFFWVVRIGSLSGGLFSYKSPLFCKLKISLQNSPAKALPTQRCFELCGARPAGAARWTPATF